MNTISSNSSFLSLKYFKGDKVIWIVVLLLSLFSILTVYSSIVTLAYKNTEGDTLYYLVKHGMFLLVGLFMTYIAHSLKYTYYSRIAQLAFIVAIPLLVLTLFVGQEINNASRWLTIPVINYSFQTSDLAKIALIMYLSRVIAKKKEEIASFRDAFMHVFLPVIIVCGLILPANLSTALMLFVTSMVIMFIGQVQIKYILTLIGIGILGLLLVVLIGKAVPGTFQRLDTWMARIERFSDKEQSEGDYQAEQAKIAVATGGIVGKGPGRSTQRNFLPHPYSDFIYAIVIEEYGLVGGAFIMLLYLIILFRGIRISSSSPKTFGTILAFGLSFSLVFQALINMAVAVNLFPVTGQPLPMVSMGGTSILFTFLSVGIVLSVSRAANKETTADEA